jgi:prolyl-tRNA synthetase
VHIVALGKEPDIAGTATRLYAALRDAGIDALLDDRQESPGVKFADADLIGVPLRLTVSTKALAAGGIEVKRRDQPERQIVPLDEVIGWVRKQADRAGPVAEA